MSEKSCICSWKKDKSEKTHEILLDDFIDRDGMYRVLIPPYLIEVGDK